MAKMTFKLLFLIVSLMGNTVLAAAIGMPEERVRWGYALGLAHVAVDDPDAATGSEWALRPLNLIYTDRWHNDSRFWGEAFYQETALDAGVGQAGQEVTQYGARLALQKHVVLTPAIAPWLGAGVQLSYNQFHKRHTIDSDGFIESSYPDRNEFNAALLLHAVVERRLDRNWNVAVKMEQAVPFADGVREFVMALALLYRY